MIAWAAFLFNELVLIAMGVYACKRGSPDEKLAMAAVLVAAVGSQIVSYSGARWREGPEYMVWAWDVALLAALLWVMHRSRKFWPLWAVGAQTVGTLTHGMRLLQPSLSRELYITAQPFWMFPVLLAIAVGTNTEASKKGPAVAR